MKKLKILVMGITLFFISLLPLDAASFGMSSSVKEVKPNGTFTINVGGDCIGRVDLTVSNGTLSTNSVWVEQGYVSVRVTAGGSGVVTVTATPVTGFSDPDANMYNPGSRKVSVTISNNPSSGKPSTPGVQKSGDNNLSSLTVNNGELSPAFNADTLEYKVELNKDVTKLTINATPKDQKAKVEGNGEHDVKPGNNYIEIKVTAENGNIKVYKINAYVDETPEVYLDYNKEKIGIVRNYEGVNIPENFTKEDYTLNDKTISIFTSEHLTLIYGLNENNEKSFYLFNKEKNEILNKFTPLNINNHIFYIIDKESERNGVILKTIKINETEVMCYEFKENNNYCVLNAINNEGKNKEYLYETSENTIQLFPDFLLKEKKNKLNINMIIYICIGLMLIPLTIIIYLIIKLKKDKKEKNEIIETNEVLSNTEPQEESNNIEDKKIKKRGKKNEKTN